METKEPRHKLNEILHTFGGRGGELSIGLTAKYLSDRVFDYLLYPFVIFELGILKGGLVMTFLAFILNIMTMLFYDWSKRDWLGIETIKDLKTYSANKKMGCFTSWLLKRSDPVIFIFLSLHYDTFTTTVYLRQGKFNGMKGRDWSVFMGSLFGYKIQYVRTPWWLMGTFCFE